MFEQDGKSPLFGSAGTITPKGIKQGGLNDCWFMAGVTALAENPERLNNVIHVNSRKSYNYQGIFRYYFWVKDKWVPINIDDRLPARHYYSNSDKYFTTIFGGKSNSGAWWMPLFEKAYAKLNGNYNRLQWGTGAESLRMLTNKPVFFF